MANRLLAKFGNKPLPNRLGLIGLPAQLSNSLLRKLEAPRFTTAQVLQELIQIAKDIRAARLRGEETGLSDEEIAFYDALAENNSAVEAMGDDQLRVIAHELLVSLRENVTVDWAHRESARARMRVLVKNILRKYGYPPDLQDVAVQTVLQQAEALSSGWKVLNAPFKWLFIVEVRLTNWFP